MNIYFHKIQFSSIEQTAVSDITSKINDVIEKSGAKQGMVIVNTIHTTMGIFLNEIVEPNLLNDITKYCLSAIPEDKRSLRVDKNYTYPTADYQHRCQNNKLCEEIDDDYDAAAHIRAITLSHPSLSIPFRDGKLSLGKYQQVGAFEFGGRGEVEKNPERQRTVQVWVYPFEEVLEI